MYNILKNSFSYFPSIFKNAGKSIDLYDLQKLTVSKSSEHFKLISKIRSSDKKEVISQLKKQLPAVSISVVISGRRNLKNILRYSNLLGIDIDHVQDLNSMREQLEKDPYVLVSFLSPSGKGLKLIFGIDGTKHLQYFRAIADYLFSEYHIQIDEQCSDVTRLMYLSHDPDFYINPNADIFALSVVEKVAPQKITYTNDAIADFISVVDEIELKQIDITANHGDWLRIGFVCADLFAENGREYFQRISQYYPGYKVAETDRQFEYCKNHKGSGISIRTFFHIAKQHGICISSKSQKETSANVSLSKGNLDSKFIFWEVEEVNGNLVIQILYTKLNELLLHLGFRRFDLSLNKIFVRIVKNVVEEVPVHKIQDSLVQWINELPNELPGGINRGELLEKIYKNPAHYFNANRLTLLKKEEKFHFKKDTHDCAFLFYTNGFVMVNAIEIKFLSYAELDGLIWRKQILQRNFFFKPIADEFESRGMFSQFLFNLCGHEKERYEGLLTITGYLLHQYYEGKRKCLILTDTRISDLPEGRTGKTLLAKAVGQVKCYSEVDGKSFDPENRFKWQEVEIDTEIICLNDVKAKFNIDELFTAITEGVKVEKKNKDPLYISAKLIITSNRVVITEGASRKDRCIEFEVSNYYSKDYSPEDEFKCWFFSDWDEAEWQMFDNLMVFALQKYLQNGLRIPEQINLDRRKLLEQTNADFVEFMDELFVSKQISPGKELEKRKLLEQFLQDYPDYVEHRIFGKMRGFTNAMRIYSKYSSNVVEVIPERDERKSGSIYYITFRVTE